MKNQKSGFTLLEMVFTITLIVFLIASILFVYIVAMRNSHHIGNRTDLHEKLHFALERMTRDIRNANAVTVSNHAVTFTLYEDSANVQYRYYLHNASDVWPPAFNQTTYDLRRAAVTGFSYGSGDLITTNLNAPSSTTITSSGNVARLRLSATAGSDTLAVSAYVRPRNA